MVNVHVEMPSGEVRSWTYPLGASIVVDGRALVVYPKGQSFALAVFPLARIVGAEVEKPA